MIGAILALVVIYEGVFNIARARIGHAQNACVNNLRQIEGAKQTWAIENHKLKQMPL